MKESWNPLLVGVVIVVGAGVLGILLFTDLQLFPPLPRAANTQDGDFTTNRHTNTNNNRPVLTQAARDARAVLGWRFNEQDWAVQIVGEKDVDQLVKRLPDLDRLDELVLFDATDAHLATIGKLQGLRSLTIRSAGMGTVTDAGMEHLKKLSKLQRFRMEQCQQVTLAGVGALTGLSELEELELVEHDHIDDGVFQHIEMLPRLRKLSLAETAIQGNGLRKLAGLNRLQELNLYRTRVSDKEAAHIAKLPQLVQLNLGDTNISDVGLAQIEGLTRITHLNISGTKITDTGLAYLRSLTEITNLDISRTTIKGDGLKHLAGWSKLNSLKLDTMQEFTGEGLQHFANCSGLHTLDLTWTAVTDAGTADIKQLKQLTDLRLPYYGNIIGGYPEFWRGLHPDRLTDTALKHIGELTNLKQLQISGGGLTDKGLAYLTRLKKLERLGLGTLPGIKGEGLNHFSAFPLLTSINLGGTEVTDEMLSRLKGVTQLEKLTLPSSTTPKAIEKLTALPNLQILAVPQAWGTEALAEAKKSLPRTNVILYRD
jgi:Leucine-rich repeat (LRR) protein